MRRNGLNTLGIVFGIIAFLMVVVSAVLLIGGRPFSFLREMRNDFELIGTVNFGREEETGEERIDGA
jgi:hypothetical protein